MFFFQLNSIRYFLSAVYYSFAWKADWACQKTHLAVNSVVFHDLQSLISFTTSKKFVFYFFFRFRGVIISKHWRGRYPNLWVIVINLGPIQNPLSLQKWPHVKHFLILSPKYQYLSNFIAGLNAEKLLVKKPPTQILRHFLRKSEQLDCLHATKTDFWVGLYHWSRFKTNICCVLSMQKRPEHFEPQNVQKLVIEKKLILTCSPRFGTIIKKIATIFMNKKNLPAKNLFCCYLYLYVPLKVYGNSFCSAFLKLLCSDLYYLTSAKELWFGRSKQLRFFQKPFNVGRWITLSQSRVLSSRSFSDS